MDMVTGQMIWALLTYLVFEAWKWKNWWSPIDVNEWIQTCITYWCPFLIPFHSSFSIGQHEHDWLIPNLNVIAVKRVGCYRAEVLPGSTQSPSKWEEGIVDK